MNLNWSEVLGGIILFLIGLMVRGLGFGFSVKGELTALKVSDESLKVQIHDIGAKVDTLTAAVNQMQGFMQGQSQGSAK